MMASKHGRGAWWRAAAMVAELLLANVGLGRAQYMGFPPKGGGFGNGGIPGGRGGFGGNGFGGNGFGQAPAVTQTLILLVRGPDGRPLQNHALSVYPLDSYGESAGTPTQSEQTDGQGRVTVTLSSPPVVGFYDLLRVGVSAPGVGFGTTGTIEVGQGQSAAAALPPLAPFASLSGTVAPALRQSGQNIYLVASVVGVYVSRLIAVDAGGRFRLDDVPPGYVSMVVGVLTSPAEQDLRTRFVYRLAPGERRTGVVLEPPPATPLPAAAPPPVHFPRPLAETGSPTRTVTLRGTVRDDGGRPIAGAKVYAQVPEEFDGNRFASRDYTRQPLTLAATTGADGAYVFAAANVVRRDVIIPLTASAPEYPPAVAEAHAAEGATGDVHTDLVLSTQHTALTVHITAPDGDPLTGALVSLTHEGVPLRFATDLRYNILDRTSPTNPFYLSGRTGADGTARFVDLVPGLWDVAANNGAVEFGRPTPDFRADERQGVAVSAGRRETCTLALSPLPAVINTLTVRVLGPDGQVVPVREPRLEVGSSTANIQYFGVAVPGAAQTGGTPVDGPSSVTGLWRINANYRDNSLEGGAEVPRLREPYNEATALVALSPALPSPGLLTLHALRHGPGSIRVRLIDAKGRPARGTVVIHAHAYSNAADYAASVDDHGEVVFPDMTSGDYTLVGHLAGQAAPVAPGGDDRVLPPEAALTGLTLPLPQRVTVTGGHETPVVLRPQPVGYVRVHLRPSPLGAAQPYFLPPMDGSVQVWRDQAAGTFLLGPYPLGQVTLPPFYPAASRFNGLNPFEGMTANVTAGRVADVIFTALPMAAPAPPPTARPDTVAGTVFLADGVTPAWGAQAVLWLPTSPNSQTLERADALGHLQRAASGLDLLERRQEYGSPPPPQTGADPTTPTLIAWLPGTAGAAVLPYTPGQAVRVVLPPTISITGRVTIGGRSALGQVGALRVRAAYQGRGRLNDLLSVDVTAQPDGAFTLDGLTPGTYLAQAARDGIWLSATRRVTVGGAPPPPLTLDIGEPGAPVTLRLSPGQDLSLDRLAGPLTDLLWPATVRADGLGDLRLDGLEAGRHRVFPTSGPAVTFDVPRTK